MKNILLIVVGFMLSCSTVFSEQITPLNNTDTNFIEVHTLELLNTIKSHRISIYSTLDLNDEQKKLIKEIDEKRYKEIEPELTQLSLLVKKLDDIAKSENCTMKKVKAVKKEFKPVQKELYNTTQKYEKELVLILTQDQKSKYEFARKQMRNKINQEQHKK